MKRNIVESMSMEEAFKALNAKSTKKLLESKNIRKKMVESAKNYYEMHLMYDEGPGGSNEVISFYFKPSGRGSWICKSSHTPGSTEIKSLVDFVVGEIRGYVNPTTYTVDAIKKNYPGDDPEDFKDNTRVDVVLSRALADTFSAQELELIKDTADQLAENCWDIGEVSFDISDEVDGYDNFDESLNESDDDNEFEDNTDEITKDNFTTIAEIVPFADFISGKTAIYFLKDFMGYTAELYIGVYDGAIYGVDPANETADYICEISDITSYEDLSLKANFDSDNDFYGEKAVLINEFNYDDLTWAEFIQKYDPDFLDPDFLNYSRPSKELAKLESLCKQHNIILNARSEFDISSYDIEPQNSYENPLYYELDTDPDADINNVVIAISYDGRIFIEEDYKSIGMKEGAEYPNAEAFISDYLKYIK